MPLFFTDNFSKFKKHKRGGLLFILPLLSISFFIINPSFAAVNSSKEPVVTVTAKNEPLKMVLNKISKATGYNIEITEGWKSKPITVDIQGMTLDDSLKKIIWGLVKPDTPIERLNDKKKIIIQIYQTSNEILSVKINEDNTQFQAKKIESMLAMDNVPQESDTNYSSKTITKEKDSKLIDELQEAMTPEDIARGDTITSDLPVEKKDTSSEKIEREIDQRSVDVLEEAMTPEEVARGDRIK